MKKSGIIVGFLAAAFGLSVVNKMQKMNTNKDSVKGKAKEAISNTKEKAEDIVGDIKDEFER